MRKNTGIGRVEPLPVMRLTVPTKLPEKVSLIPCSSLWEHGSTNHDAKI
jgi:hypothetical protein